MPPEKQQDCCLYALLLAFLTISSLASGVLFIRDPFVPLIDARSYQEVLGCRGTARQSTVAAGLNSAVTLIGVTFMVWRATSIWHDNRLLSYMARLGFILHIGVTAISFWYQVEALTRVARVALAEVHSENLETVLVEENVVAPIQKVYHWWRTAELLASVGASVLSSVLIIMRLALNKEIAGDRGSLRRGLHLLIESSLPFTLLGVAEVFSRRRISEINFLLPGHSILMSYASPYANHFMQVLWTNGSVLGPQLILFRILLGKTWTSNPIPLGAARGTANEFT
ncbi:hypothetical protein BKA70DRAFT_1307328 [Coprinopsis sp. MPI-PUGE-AT-0042]|nr:hypothetical protein BKA70DRAFT_1307328 [Coprinopsis sp. MPI-PUGE-AT-0042]